MEKRQDYITWNEYFMGIAIFSAERSKDPNTGVGACIVDNEKHIVGIGYNGMPNGVSDDEMPWAREGEPLDTKYLYVCHAELNAIQNANKRPKNCTIYVTLFPCNDCAKQIIQSGIKKIVYLSDKYKDLDSTIASKRMFDQAGIKYEKYMPRNRKITMNL